MKYSNVKEFFRWQVWLLVYSLLLQQVPHTFPMECLPSSLIPKGNTDVSSSPRDSEASMLLWNIVWGENCNLRNPTIRFLFFLQNGEDTYFVYILREVVKHCHPVFQLVSLEGIIIVEQLKDSSRKNPGFLSHFFKGLVYWQFPFSHKTNWVPLQMGPLNM